MSLETQRIPMENILQLLPNFDGKKENNIEYFIDQYDQVIKLAELHETLKVIVLKNKISGTARDTLINSPEIFNENNYENLKSKLIQMFKPCLSLEDAQDNFEKLKQNPTQTIGDFAKVLDAAANKYLVGSGLSDKEGAIEFLDKMKFTKFLDNIRPDIALEVRKIGPNTYTEAVEIGKKIEKAFNSIPKESINTMTVADSNKLCETLFALNKKQSDEINELKNQLAKINIASSQNSSKPEICEICNKRNHKTSMCWYNVKNKINRRRNYSNWQNTANRSQFHNMMPTQNFAPFIQGDNQNYRQNYMPSPGYIPTMNHNYDQHVTDHNNEMRAITYNTPNMSYPAHQPHTEYSHTQNRNYVHKGQKGKYYNTQKPNTIPKVTYPPGN